MTTCPDAGRLKQFLDDTLAGAEDEAFASHIETCAACQRTLDQLLADDEPDWAILERAEQTIPAGTVAVPGLGTAEPPAAWSSISWIFRRGEPHGTREPAAACPTLDGYEIMGELGRGGMGVVYKARRVLLNRTVALKMILAGHHAGPDAVARFLAEAEAVARLQHPNVVQVYHVDEHDGRPYFEMEYLGGGSLADHLNGTPRPPREAARIIERLAHAMAEAHRRGIVHRDLKPSNVLLTPEGSPKVADFGLAKLVDAESRMTQTNSVVGSPSYMAPEQADRKLGDVGPAADIYALGAIFYETLTGRPPFRGTTVLETLRQVGTVEPVPPSRLVPDLPRDLETIVLKCLEKAPQRRFTSAGALADDLARWLKGEPISARPVSAVERLAKWVGRKPVLAGLSALSGVLLLTLAIGGPWAAWQQRSLVARERKAREEGSRSEQKALVARAAEAKARRRADLTLADMQTVRGLQASAQQRPTEAILWFAAAAQQAETAEDPDRRAANNLRARNWLRQAVLPVGVFALDDGPKVVRFQPGGALLLLRTEHKLSVGDWRENRILPWTQSLGEVVVADWSPDGASLALGLRNGEVQLRRAEDGTVLDHWSEPDAVTALAFSADGTYLAVASRAVRVRNLKTHAFLEPTWVHPAPVFALVFNRAGDRLVAASLDEKARVFAVSAEPNRPAPVFAPVPHVPDELSPPVFVDDRTLVTISAGPPAEGHEGQLVCWDVATGGPTKARVIDTMMRLMARLAVSRDGHWLAACGYSGAEVWDRRKPKSAPILLEHANFVEDIAFSRDGALFLSGGWDRVARLWELPSGRAVGPPLGHIGSVARCTFADDGLHFATAQSDGLVRVWQRPGSVVKAYHERWAERPRLSSDGRFIAPGYWHESPLGRGPHEVARPVILDARTGDPAGPRFAPPGALIDSCVCADSRTVAAVSLAGSTGWLSSFEIATGRKRHAPVQLPAEPLSVAARPGGSHVAVLCMTGHVLIFDVRTGERVFELSLEGWEVLNNPWARVEYTPDGASLLVLTPERENAVQVRDASTGKLRYAPIRPVLQGGPCRTFALSADSRLLATAVNGKNAVQVWDLSSGRALCPPLLHPGDFYGLFAVRFSPDGQRLLTGCKDGQARLWDWRAGTLACPPLKLGDEVFDVAFTPDGGYALAVVRGQPQRLHLFELSTGKPIAPPQQIADLDTTSVQTIAIEGNGSRVFLGLSPEHAVAVIDLEQLLSPPNMTTEELLLLGELASGQRIELGDVSSLTNDQWLERWERLMRTHGDLSRRTPE